jgi:hypothetical protein
LPRSSAQQRQLIATSEEQLAKSAKELRQREQYSLQARQSHLLRQERKQV